MDSLNPHQPERHVGYWCSRISRAMRGILDARLEPWGLNSSEAFILIALDRDASPSICSLARASGHTHPSVLKQVETLMLAGLVTTSGKAGDRRVRTVQLTPAGKQRILEIFEIIAAVNREATAGLEPRILERLLVNLRLIHDNVTVTPHQAEEIPSTVLVGEPSLPHSCSSN